MLVPVALAIIMFGLGVTLTPSDFARALRRPGLLIVALACQLVVLPAFCFGLVAALQLPPLFAVGLVILAASPGGATANLFSHLFGGEVAVNISLTAINSVISLLTIPVLVHLATSLYLPNGEGVGLQPGKVVEMAATVLLPVALGMLLRHLRPTTAARAERPVRIASMVVLALLVITAVVPAWPTVVANLGGLVAAAALLGAGSFTIGYLAPRLAGIDVRRAITAAFEIGIHNAGVAIFVATSALGLPEAAVPAAVYVLVMNVLALAFGFGVARPALARARTPLSTGAD
ncbi:MULTISPECIES: bile acid:sodium symporter family protein [unclassified Frondihabitans]|uniref:bile acid:sodium symporter family protein n=1 Tax=unclassified Frondihabitans TaxID=2626248 RepID=UPI000F4ED4EB|nr:MULTISPECIES: bile acid:sodium symporter family protein [unclassified Frondihabitans]RPE77722.1 BASS family bile acid:Na+ symporter [Frondihabitans sp. PhB153]RPF08000.1 BASS family bile acid:Na+ symporter [Frondihabitans sp. PhB161]